MRRPTTTKACSAWGNQPPDERRSRAASQQPGPTTDAPTTRRQTRPKGHVHNDQAGDEAQVPRGGVAAVNSNMEPALSRQEADQLTVCEAVVDEGLRTFVEVGTALATIRDGKLYRQTHNDFASYLSDRFGIGRSQGYRLIDAAAVALSPIGDTITNEAQARELVTLLDDPDRMRDVVAKAEASGKITAASLRTAREAAEPAVDEIGQDDEPGRPDVEQQPSTPPALKLIRGSTVRSGRRRRPLPDAFRDGTRDLGRTIDRLARLVNDDRWSANAATCRRHHAELLAASDKLRGVLDAAGGVR
jgi:hypothetical protein